MNVDLSVAIKLLKSVREENEQLKLEIESLRNDVNFFMKEAKFKRCKDGYTLDLDKSEVERTLDKFLEEQD